MFTKNEAFKKAALSFFAIMIHEQSKLDGSPDDYIVGKLGQLCDMGFVDEADKISEIISELIIEEKFTLKIVA